MDTHNDAKGSTSTDQEAAGNRELDLKERQVSNEAAARNRELDLKEREINYQEASCAREFEIKDRELKVKEVELRRSKWLNPVVLGLFVAIIGLFGNLISSWYTERLKLRSTLIVQAITTGPEGPIRACKNLVFLVKEELLEDPKGAIASCEKSPENGPYLPSSPSSNTSEGPPSVPSIVEWREDSQSGLIVSKGDFYLPFSAKDCSKRLLAALHSKDIPPNPPLRVKYNLSSGSAVNVDLAE